jgi:hypothetical protein
MTTATAPGEDKGKFYIATDHQRPLRAQRRRLRDATQQGLRGTQQGFQMSTARLLGKCGTAGAAKGVDFLVLGIIISFFNHLHPATRLQHFSALGFHLMDSHEIFRDICLQFHY